MTKKAALRRLSLVLLAVGVLSGCGSKSRVLAPTGNGDWAQTSGPSDTYAYAIYANDYLVVAATQQGIERSTNGGVTWSIVQDQIATALASVRGTLFAASTHGVLRSRDHGATWTLSDEGLVRYHGRPFDVAARGSDVFASYIIGVAVSSNGGDSWTLLNAGLPPGYSPTKLFYAASAHEMLAWSPYSGLYRLGDGESTWSRTTAQPMGYDLISMFETGSILLASGSGGVQRRVDGVWEPNLTSGIDVSSHAFGFAEDATGIFAATSSGLYESTDKGAHWTHLETGLPAATPYTAIAAEGHLLYAAAGGGGMLRSWDHGAHWFGIGARDGTPNFIVEDRGTLVVGSSGGVQVSNDDGLHWHLADLPVTGGALCGLAWNGTIYVGSNCCGLFLSSDGGAHWSQADFQPIKPVPVPVLALVSDGTGVTAALDDDTIFHTSDDGHTWTPATGITSGFVQSMAAADGRLLAASLDGGLLGSVDHGATWGSVGGGLPTGTTVNWVIADGTRVWVQTGAGDFVSHDSGATFLASTSDDLHPWFLARHGDTRMAVDFSRRLLRSADGGATWRVDDTFPGWPRAVGAGSSGFYVGGEKSGVWKQPY